METVESIGRKSRRKCEKSTMLISKTKRNTIFPIPDGERDPNSPTILPFPKTILKGTPPKVGGVRSL